jgi:Pyruvate/2-oxoacid:ferredoxin oxidoreductase gamma subunit/NAD-dependent dihydropyrimidine dehydrogenase PreA subunit
MPKKNSISVSNLKILIAGEGGQGVQRIGEILNMAAYKEGYQTMYIPNYGVEQRGGVSLAYVQISDSPIPYPKFKIADILAVLCKRAVLRVKNYYDRKTKIINGVELTKKLKEHNLPYRTYNMLILGILSEFLPLKKELLLWAMANRFKKVPAELMKQNKQAFLLGRGLGMRLPSEARKIGTGKTELKPIRKLGDWTFNPNLCKSCGICIYRCPVGALHFNAEISGIYGGPTPEVDTKKCIKCGLCERVCPDTAIFVQKKKARKT